MKRVLVQVSFLLVAVSFLSAQNKPFKAAVVNMQMTECTFPHRFVSSLSGTLVIATVPCAEYTVLGDKVVYVIVGRHTEQSLSLGQDLFFREDNKELVVFSDDEKSRARFPIKQMVLRPEWEHQKALRDEVTREAIKQTMQRALSCEPPSTVVTASSE